MYDPTARILAPAGIALFAALGVLMTPRPNGAATTVAVVAVVIALVLSWLRMTGWPLLVGLTAVAGAFVYLGHLESANLAWMGLCVIAGWTALLSATPVGIVMGAGLCVVPVAEWLVTPAEAGWGAWFVGISFTTVSCVFARRLRLTVLQLRQTQAELAERTRAEERNRIAAEVHDVIGHALTVSLLHVSSARLALDEEPAQAHAALEEAERLTRNSLEEVRATVGLMRADAPNPTVPPPHARGIPALVESFRRAGSDVSLDVTGELSSVGPSRGLVAYRTVQEALTNALKHAPGRPVTVRVDVTATGTTVSVGNRGTADPAATPGAGLLGMAERIEGAGGRLTAGPTDTGWLVTATVPS